MSDSNLASSADNNAPPTAAAPLPAGWLADRPWIAFVLPFIVFAAFTGLEPKPPHRFEDDKKNTAEAVAESSADETPEQIAEPDEGFWAADPGYYYLIPAISYSYYPQIYTAKIMLVALSMVLVWPVYRTFPFHISGLSIGVGVVGVFVWVGICKLQLEPMVFAPIDRFLGSIVVMLPGLEGNDNPSIGLMSLFGSGERSGYNPLKEMADAGAWAYAFLGVRFIGLALLVPIFEEFLYRGFMVRFMVHPQWWQVPFGVVNRSALIAITVIPMLSHAGEMFAALAWFSMITWLMLRTRNIWDCIAAHAVTNFLLGIYVIWSGDWYFM